MKTDDRIKIVVFAILFWCLAYNWHVYSKVIAQPSNEIERGIHGMLSTNTNNLMDIPMIRIGSGIR